MRAATVGGCSPGLTATRNLNRSVEGSHRRGDDPGILAALSSGQQHAVVAELIGSLRDLAQIRQIGGAAADGSAEVPAVSMGRQEPQHAHAVGVGIGCDIHDCGFLTASAIEIACRDQAEFEEDVGDLLLRGHHLRRDRLHAVLPPLDGDLEHVNGNA